ncbi:MAG: hypothetical protein RBR22_02055 [Desulfuromonas sp.]|nr:hypothetical protein [Desulfuromonas sp.]
MHRLPQLRAIELGIVVTLFCMCLSCSHLNVGVEPSWSASDLSVVSIEHEQAPESVTTADISALLNRGGWQVVQDPAQAQARVVCRWTRQTDLNSESEAIAVVKSFHVQVISVTNPRVLAVADYFYANNSEKLIDGVTSALTAITQYQAAPEVIAKPKQEATTNLASTSPSPAPATVSPEPTTVSPTAKTVNLAAPITAPAPSVSTTPEVTAVQPVVDTSTIELNESQPTAIPNETLPIQQVQQLSNPEPVNMERSPWIPRFQGLGLEEWGKTAPMDE